jgi:hypothetical protein
VADGHNAWTLLSGILETAVEYGYLTVNPARGEVPAGEAASGSGHDAGDDFGKLLKEVDEPYRDDDRTHRRDGIEDWRAVRRDRSS